MPLFSIGVQIGFTETVYTALENRTLSVTVELVSGVDFSVLPLSLTTQDGSATGLV